jgi:hypothetical protein
VRRNEDDPKEKPVSEKSAVRLEPPINLERDTLPTMDTQLLLEQLEAVLSLPVASSGHAPRVNELDSRVTAPVGSDTSSSYDDDTEPSVDTRLLRDAILAAGKSA